MCTFVRSSDRPPRVLFEYVYVFAANRPSCLMVHDRLVGLRPCFFTCGHRKMNLVQDFELHSIIEVEILKVQLAAAKSTVLSEIRRSKNNRDDCLFWRLPGGVASGGIGGTFPNSAEGASGKRPQRP